MKETLFPRDWTAWYNVFLDNTNGSGVLDLSAGLISSVELFLKSCFDPQLS